MDDFYNMFQHNKDYISNIEMMHDMNGNMILTLFLTHDVDHEDDEIYDIYQAFVDISSVLVINNEYEAFKVELAFPTVGREDTPFEITHSVDIKRKNENNKSPQLEILATHYELGKELPKAQFLIDP